MARVRFERAVLFRLADRPQVRRAVHLTGAGQRAAWQSASRYIAGPTVSDAERMVTLLGCAGVAASVDLFGERVQTARAADTAADTYLALAMWLADLPPATWLSVDLSHLGLDVDPAGCATRLSAIARALPVGRRIQIGAEDHARAEPVLRCVLDVAAPCLAGRLGATVQANLRRAPDDLQALVEAGVGVRLVKGTFLEPTRYALPFGEATDLAYQSLAHRLADLGAVFWLATHDAVLRETLLGALGPRPVEQLLGVHPEALPELVARSVPVRVYVPYGPDWIGYWLRRLAESHGK